jgi:hypothetical protein
MSAVARGSAVGNVPFDGDERQNIRGRTSKKTPVNFKKKKKHEGNGCIWGVFFCVWGFSFPSFDTTLVNPLVLEMCWRKNVILFVFCWKESKFFLYDFVPVDSNSSR